MRGATIAILLAGSFVTANAQANQFSQFEELYYTVDEVNIELVETPSELKLETLTDIQDPCGERDGTSHWPFKNSVSLDQIINLGQKVWKIIEANKPVVDFKSKSASALPRGIKCWDQLENWQFPKAQTYKVSYKNLMGIEVVRFSFRLIFTYGGQYFGKGRYITNATIVPAEINVLWGYKFAAGVKVGQTVNLGSRQDPKAGIELNLNWQVATPLVDQQRTATYFLSGEGQVAEYQ